MQKVFKGNDALKELEKELKVLAPKRILLVRGKNSYENCGASNIFDPILRENAEKVLEFKDFEVNPNFEDLENGLETARNFKPDLIVAVGGGSVLDMAKSIRFLMAYDGDIETNEYTKKDKLIPLIAVPTTSGTGSEATKFAILYKDKVKHSVDHEDALPDYVVLIPSLTENHSPYLTACCGFDALAQAIEALWNKFATPESDEFARKALELLAPNLEQIIKKPSSKLRELIQEGAYWAGRAINITRTTAPHAFSYVFTSNYGYPHGHAVALTFPAIAELNLLSDKVSNEKKKLIFTSCRIDSKDIFNGFKNFTESIGLGVKPADYNKELILSSINAGRLKNNPVNINQEGAKNILDKTLA